MVTRVEKSTPNAPPGGDDQAGDFAGLDAIAAEGAKLNAPPPGDKKAEQEVLASEASEIETALGLLRSAALPFARPDLQAPLQLLWSDEQLHEIAEALVDCARASGLSVSDLFKGYGPWIKLGFALGVPALATLKVLRMPPPPPTVERVDGQQQPA